MKHLYNLTLGLAAAAAMSLASCADDVAPETPAAPAEGRTVWMSIDVSRGTDPDSRLTHEEAEGYLDADWESGDVIYVFTNKRHTDDAYYDYAYAGTLTYSETVSNTSGATGGHTATFTGSLTIPDGFETGDKVTLWYVGKKADGTAREFTPGKDLVIDYSSQPGTFASMAYNDIMDCTEFDVTVNGNTVTSEATAYMRHVAMFFHFATDLAADTKVVINTEAKNLNGNFIVQANGLTGMGRKSDGLTVTVSEGGHLYVSMLPFNESALTFTVGSGTADEKTITLPAKTLSTGNYYTGDWNATTGKHDGIQLTFGTPNPGDINNWPVDGFTIPYPILTGDPNTTRVGVSEDAWAWNKREYAQEEIGWCIPYTYEYNSIRNGCLTSNSYSNGAEAKYFQWGRWLGFPSYVENAEVDMLSMALYGTTAGARGLDFTSSDAQRRLFYAWGNNYESYSCYAYTLAWESKKWTPQQAKNSSIIFFTGNTYDYLQSAYSDLNWSDRSGNPCPNEWRIPTEDEMNVFIPSCESFTNSYAEIKMINGVKFAVKWEKSGNNVVVKSVKTSKDNVAVNDPIFDNVKSITLRTDGKVFYYVYHEGYIDQQRFAAYTNEYNDTYFGGYWTSTTAKLNGNNAGRVMMVEVTGSNVKIYMTTDRFITGWCIMPFHDEKAKASSCQPWAPLGY